jgi:hypothetical protein
LGLSVTLRSKGGEVTEVAENDLIRRVIVITLYKILLTQGG